MYRRQPQGWLKHIDFGICDFICLQLALLIAGLTRFEVKTFYRESSFLTLMLLTAILSVLIIFFGNTYSGIMKRGLMKEMQAVIFHVGLILLLDLLVMFAMKTAGNISRLFFGYFFVFGVIFCYIVRVCWRNHLKKVTKATEGNSSLLLVTVSGLVEEFAENIMDNNYGRYKIAGIVLLDKNAKGKSIH